MAINIMYSMHSLTKYKNITIILEKSKGLCLTGNDATLLPQ